MLRAIVGVIVGYALWSGLWVGGGALLLAKAGETVARGEPFTQTLPLLGALALSVVCSLLSGLVCAKIAGAKSRGAAIALSVCLLLTGIAVQAGVWNLEPVWYHVMFLALLVPLTLLGARLAGAGRGA